MTGYELYVFTVCAVSFLATLSLLSAMLFIIVRREINDIKLGRADEKIIKEYVAKTAEHRAFSGLLHKLLCLFALVILAVFAWALYLQFSNPLVKGSVAVPRVVLSNSMSYKRESNAYLSENGLNDQFDTFDIIFTHELPSEFELELYDVVVYEIKGELVVHRIVAIEEPNEKHPDHRLFKLQGDALKNPDELAVQYSQMRSVYLGKRIPYAGSFICFLQSPAGYLCILITVIGFIVAPIVEGMIRKKKKIRLRYLGFYP